MARTTTQHVAGVHNVTSAPRPGARWLLRTLLVVLARPRLWGIAIRQSLRLARPGWWRRPPFLPIPDAAYLRFRLLTMYGSDHDPDPADIVPYLEWCRSWPATTPSTS